MSSNESSSDESEVGEVDESQLQELESRILENPYDYTAHTGMIKLLEAAGDVDRCREVRERMSGLFPLSPELWLEWIRQERMFYDLDKDRVSETLKNLYSRAVKDYVSVRLWCQYCSDAISVLQLTTERTREVFEEALSAVGLHVSKGGEVWEQFRNYEEALLAATADSLGEEGENEEDKELLQDMYNEQRKRVDALFQRQLSVPLRGLESVMAEYKEWLGSEGSVSVSLQSRYEAAVKKRDSLLPYEDALEMTAAPHTDEYQGYIEHERKEGDPARVVMVIERALTDDPLDAARWTDYLQYLDQVIKVKSVVLGVYGRAVRNIPWVADVWAQYMTAQQRYQLHFTHIDETLEEALKNGFQDAPSYLSVWRTYLACHWRQERFQPLKTNGSASEALENRPLNEAFQRAVNFVNQTFGEEGDKTGSLTRFMAECDGVREDPTSMRTLMSGLFDSKIYKEQARLWMEWVNLEMRFGSVEDARRVYQKAIQCSTDSPELLIQNFLSFESLHGTLEAFDSATLKCRRLQKRIDEKRAKEAAREKQKKGDEKKKTPQKPDKQQKQHGQKQSNQKKAPDTAKSEHKPPSNKRKLSSSAAEEPAKQPKKSEFPRSEPKPDTPVDKSRYPVTVFVSNLSYSATEDDLNATFKHIGSVVDIRLVKSVNGKSRGFGYIEFHTREEALAALEMDRVPVLGRPCYVSECKEKPQGQRAEFKFGSGLEMRKVYVSNLPYTATEEEIRGLFAEVGEISTLRMVTTKSGKFKGYLYVEFASNAEASKAVMELNGREVGGRTMAVAISNPPAKSASGGSSSGGADAPTTAAPQRQKQSVNFAVPRALATKQAEKKSDDSKAMMSNSDFAKLFKK